MKHYLVADVKRYQAECLGTFFLALIMHFSVNYIAIGVVYMAMLYLMRPLSGGHVNPAISIGMAMNGKISWRQFPWYVLAQIVGACLAFVLSYVMLDAVIQARVIPEQMIVGAATFELLLTMVLCGVVLYSSVFRFKDSHVHGLIGGLTLAGLLTFTGIYNPAIALGSMLSNWIGGHGDMPGLTEICIYIILPLLGGFIAGLYVQKMYVHPKE